MTFEDIQKANGLIQTTTIEKKNNKTGKVTSKEYAEVNQRIKAFRSLYPEGFIRTTMLSNEGGVAVFRAEVGYYGEYGTAVVLGTGTAYEKESSTFINATSYIENCETSAIGRALGMCGIGIDTSIASAEEVQNAMLNQDIQKMITKEEAEILTGICAEKNVNFPKLLAMYKVETPEMLTAEQYANIMKKLKEADKK